MTQDAQLPLTTAPRCAMCGAPLPGNAGSQVTCAFCGSLNLVESDETRLIRQSTQRLMDATEQAREMYQQMQPRMQELEELLKQAYLDRDLERALHWHEALLRLVSAPQYHILRAADQSQSWVQRGYRELEQTLASSLHKIRDEWKQSGRAQGARS
ncbi:MAG: hypothetical protein ABIJ09_03300 [Pseudomonadota bacterium]